MNMEIKNIACCDTEFNWFISNCENSINLIGEVIRWIEIDQESENL